MTDLTPTLMASLLGIGTGIFAVLSFIEKPVWRLMRTSRSPHVSDQEARAVHAILKRVIHLLPPTMFSAMSGVSVLMIVMLIQSGFSTPSLVLAIVFFVQLILIVSRLAKDIRGVDDVRSDGDVALVRDGLGALALLHHRGLLMTASTLILVWLHEAWLR